MFRSLRIPFSALLGVLIAGPLVAQDHALTVSARGGGYSALANLNDAGTADFKTGFNVVGGVGVTLTRYVVVRGDFTFARSEFRTNGTGSGIDVNRYFYGGAVQLQYPFANGLTPYLFGGGGAVTLHQENTSGQNKTKGAGTFGLGVRYTIPRSRVGLFAEGAAWVYKVNGASGTLAGFDKTQFDALYSGGVSYSFSL